MKRQVIYYGNPLLRKRCEEVAEITDETRALVTDLTDTMEAHNAAGLAAPQIGVLLRVFVLHDYIIEDEGRKWSISKDVRVYINPRIEILTEEEEEASEGCISIPKLRVDVFRPLKIKVTSLHLSGESFEEIIEGYNARVRLHENDHLNGVLNIDRTDPRTRRLIEPELRAIKKKYN
ncbi:MAG: peptide deformylase [Chlamydiota bacterium]